MILHACNGQNYLSDDKHLIGAYYFFEAGPQSCIVYNGRTIKDPCLKCITIAFSPPTYWVL